MSNMDLTNYTGHLVADDGELTDLNDVIGELSGFVEQFSTHAMNNSDSADLKGRLAAYQDVIDYLDRVKPLK